MTQRLWWQEDAPTSGEKLMPKADLIAWFKEATQTFKTTASEGKVPPGVPPAPPEIYWHGKNGRACSCAGCCAGAGVVLFDPATQALTEKTSRRRLSAAS
jgi:hypothetical protein